MGLFPFWEGDLRDAGLLLASGFDENFPVLSQLAQHTVHEELCVSRSCILPLGLPSNRIRDGM